MSFTSEKETFLNKIESMIDFSRLAINISRL